MNPLLVFYIVQNVKLLPKNEQANNGGRKAIWIHPKNVKPVAWLIIIGDAFHNIADGLALGAAISQNLSLGISTMFALVFHELPHEFGKHYKQYIIIQFIQYTFALDFSRHLHVIDV